jgi:hypothetical protein
MPPHRLKLATLLTLVTQLTTHSRLLLALKPAFLLWLMAMPSSFALEETETLAPSVGVHGMLLFGNDSALFASHLPMYHAPHNAQVILKLKFSDPNTQIQVQQAIAHDANKSAAIWSLVPTVFDLARLAVGHPQQLTQLTVDIFEGHFERGGTLRWAKRKLGIEEVVLFSPLSLINDDNKPAKTLNYVLLRQHDNDSVQFAIKRLGTRPEADHLLRLSGINQALPTSITVKLEPLTKPVNSQQSQAATPAQLVDALISQLKRQETPKGDLNHASPLTAPSHSVIFEEMYLERAELR